MRFALAAVVAACVLAVGPAEGRTLRYATQDDPQTLDPHAVSLLPTSRLLSQVYDPLVFRDRDWKVMPWLAVSWQQVGEKVWRFKLREGVRFHDGTPFTADDVVFSVERALSPTSQMRSAIQGVEGARRIDDTTVELVLAQPNPALLQHLPYFRIMSRAWAAKHGALKPQDYKNREDTYAARNANGTGPFKVREWSPDVRVRLERNADWWGQKAGLFESNLDEVVVLPIRAASTRLAALLSGEVDFVIDPPTQDVARVKANPQLKVVEVPESRVQYLAFDLQRDELLYGSVKDRNPFKDARVRQAVAMAIDADAIRTKVMRGFARAIGTPITSSVVGYDRGADQRPAFDRERARKLLADAGYASGFDVTLDCGNTQPAADICQAVAAMLTQVGVRTRPNIIQQANFYPKLEKYDSSFYLLSWGGGVTSDAFYTLNLLFHTPRAGTGDGDFNMGRWSNPAMDALLEKIRVEPDAARRNAEIREALVLAGRELPIVSLHQPLIPWVMRRNVEAWPTPVNTAYFFRMKLL